MDKIRKNFRLGISIIILGTLILSVVTKTFYLLIAGIFVSVLYYVYCSKRLRTLYKREVVASVLHELFDKGEYHPDYGFDRERIYETRLFGSGNRYHSEDYYTGTYKGIPLEFADVSIKHVVQSGKTTTTTVYFTGQWIILKPQRRIESELYVLDRDNNHSRPKGWFFGGQNLNEVQTESVQFNNTFKVFASDEHEAFYILTPPMMERFLRLDNRDISMYQDNREIHLAIRSKRNILEPSLFTSDSIDGDKEKTRDEVLGLLSVVDEIVDQQYRKEDA